MRFANVSQSLAVAALLVVAAVQLKAQGSPEYYLVEPATKYGNQQFGTSPAMAVFNGEIYIAYMSNGGDKTLYITKSSDGVNFLLPAQHYTSVVMESATAPALAVFNNELWLAYAAANGEVYLASSSDGVNFSTPALITNSNTGGPVTSTAQPSLAAYNGLLWITTVSNPFLEGSNYLPFTLTTANGTTFNPNSNYCGEEYEVQAGAGVGMAVFNNALYWAFRTTTNNQIEVCSWEPADGYSGITVLTSLESADGISATAYNGELYLAYKNTSNNNLMIAGSANGETFTANQYSGIQINGSENIAPSTTVFDGLYYLAQTANNSSHDMYLTNNE